MGKKNKNKGSTLIEGMHIPPPSSHSRVTSCSDQNRATAVWSNLHRAVGWIFQWCRRRVSVFLSQRNLRKVFVNLALGFDIYCLNREKFIYEWDHFSVPHHLHTPSAPQSLFIVDSLMMISVRISVLQNSKRTMTSSFHLYHSWHSAAVSQYR